MRVLILLLACVLLLGAAFQIPRHDPRAPHPYLACADKRVMTYGSGHRTTAIAELAAIAEWMDRTAELGEGYANWALAQDRWLRCQRVGRTPFQQCRIAALPCRPKRLEGGAGAPDAA